MARIRRRGGKRPARILHEGGSARRGALLRAGRWSKMSPRARSVQGFREGTAGAAATGCVHSRPGGPVMRSRSILRFTIGRFVAGSVVLLAGARVGRAEIRLPAILGDGMVLQREA